MPIQHMVMVKFKTEVSDNRIGEWMNELEKLWGSTPGITYFAGGPYASAEGLNQGYTHGFLVTFETPAARDAYLVHPDHQKIVERIVPDLDGIVAFDFVATKSGGVTK